MKRKCDICGQEHNFVTIKEMTHMRIKGNDFEYEAEYFYCGVHDEFYATEDMIDTNNIKMKEAYRKFLLNNKEKVMIFEQGKYYVTKDRDRMLYISEVCSCDHCANRGFYEPYAIKFRLGELPIEDYISIYEKDALIADIDLIIEDSQDEIVQRFFYYARETALKETEDMIESATN